MSIELQPHQKEAYEKVLEKFSKSNRTAVIFPTGCGKSFIALKLLEDNKEKRALFISPSHEINRQLRSYIEKYIGKDKLPKLTLYLYQGLLKMSDEVMRNLKPEIIVMDEIHRAGAEKWEEKVRKLIEMYPNAKILGVTATPERMDEKNMVEEMFEENIASEITLQEAIRKGIVKPPKYVTAIYSFKKELDDIKNKIVQCENTDKKNTLIDKYNKAKNMLDKADGLPEIFCKNMTEKNGKYIVFCKDTNHIRKMIEESKIWLKDIDSNPEIYVATYENTKQANSRQIKDFENSKTNHLKLLFSVDKLNEGLHVEDIDGVIMLRPTKSRIIYLQQLGRALSSDKNRKQPIVFDIVNNCIYQDLDREINDPIRKGINSKNSQSRSRVTSMQEIDNFKITGELKEFCDIINGIKYDFVKNAQMDNLKEIKKWKDEHGDKLPKRIENPKSKEEEIEYNLARKQDKIKQKILKKYKGMPEDDIPEDIYSIIKFANNIGINLKTENVYLKNIKEIEEWVKNNGGRLPREIEKPKTQEEEIEYKLARKKYKIKKMILEKYRNIPKNEIPEDILEIIEIADIIGMGIGIETENPYLKKIKEISEWTNANRGNLPKQIKNPKTQEELKELQLWSYINPIKQRVLKKYANMDHEKLPEDIQEIIRISDDIGIAYKARIEGRQMANLIEIKEWSNEHGGRLPKDRKNSKNKEEMIESQLKWKLDKIKSQILRPYADKPEEEIPLDKLEIIKFAEKIGIKYEKLEDKNKKLQALKEEKERLEREYCKLKEDEIDIEKE